MRYLGLDQGLTVARDKISRTDQSLTVLAKILTYIGILNILLEDTVSSFPSIQTRH